jgi:pimeloyl-ACP methyl ester carboxylesterase
MGATEQAEDRFVRLGGLRLHYRCWGRPEFPPVVILHGLNSHANDWDILGRGLADCRRILALTLRGHGKSDWAADYGWERVCEDVEELAHALNIGRFSLFGYSLGGAFAYLYAALHPERVASLVVVDQGVDIEPSFLPRLQSILEHHRQHLVLDDPEEAVVMWRTFDPRAREAAIRHTIRHGLRQTDDGRWTWRDDPVSWATVRPIYQPSPDVRWAMLARVACPTLLIRAAESEIYGRATIERMARTIPDCRLVEIQESSHRVHWDQPEALVSVVRAFLVEDAPTLAVE